MDKTLLQRELLRHLDEVAKGVPTTLNVAKELHWDHDKAVGIVKSLERMGKVHTIPKTLTAWELTDEGNETARLGSAEFRVMQLLLNGPQAADNIRKKSSEPWRSIGLNVLLKNKWARIHEGEVELNMDSLPDRDPVRDLLTQLQTGSLDTKNFETELQQLSKRKLVAKITVNYFEIEKTDHFSVTIETYETDLTKDLLVNDAWKALKFKAYNFNAAGIIPHYGSVHPLVQTLNIFRNIMVQMGFEEMLTQRWVESSFWNFDALFQPQTHPVRDAHDTFFLDTPEATVLPTKDSVHPRLDYFMRVKQMHEAGDSESLGWQCEWKESEACKLLMRTHTTAITSQVLTEMGEEYRKTGVFIPKRFFSIDRVFRNESLDATHLAEFHQVEGVIAERGASLATLMVTIASFFSKIGITQLKYKPAYNPYTEPSMEIFGFHPTMKKWTEIGNSGVFRPEMLKPMRLPEDVVVLGWGLSLERPTMINHNVKDIRSLFGPKSKLNALS